MLTTFSTVNRQRSTHRGLGYNDSSFSINPFREGEAPAEPRFGKGQEMTLVASSLCLFAGSYRLILDS